jgi:hypothetical protein
MDWHHFLKSYVYTTPFKPNNMEQNKNAQPQQTGSGAEKTTGTEQGRQPDAPQRTATEPDSDISQVDQQEGQMDNGELGGNFAMDEAGTA